ncbi:hypothetical protein [Pseudomonas lopnurensis]|uniref:hypothetical protein n=1 Tax=Pseudomonas lopnurensis TaxID=1477517 RepID=UPI0028AE8369|nr:hypothetical protein [Pseudomonas lopnurensis]
MPPFRVLSNEQNVAGPFIAAKDFSLCYPEVGRIAADAGVNRDGSAAVENILRRSRARQAVKFRVTAATFPSPTSPALSKKTRQT